jgi:hypothetical protein
VSARFFSTPKLAPIKTELSHSGTLQGATCDRGDEIVETAITHLKNGIDLVLQKGSSSQAEELQAAV